MRTETLGACTYSDFAGRPLSVNREVQEPEAETSQRNQASGDVSNALGGNPCFPKPK